MQYLNKSLIPILVVITLYLVACSTDNSEGNEIKLSEVPTENADSNESQKERETNEEPLTMKEEEIDINNEILAEEGVQDSKIVLLNNEDASYLLVDISITGHISVDYKALAEKYAHQLKEKYPKQIVDIKLLKDNETIEQITIE